MSLNIDFDQLIRIIQNLPDDKKAIVKSRLENKPDEDSILKKSDFREFLLKAPVMTEEEYVRFLKNREKLNQWRTS